MFLRHEGFLGSVGAFLSVHPMAGGAASPAVSASRDPRKVPDAPFCATPACKYAGLLTSLDSFHL